MQARSHHKSAKIGVEEVRTPDSRDMLIGYRAKCEICGRSVIDSSYESAVKELKGEQCK